MFCRSSWKESGKDLFSFLRDIEMNQYSGGAAAIARHLSDFCGSSFTFKHVRRER